MPLECLIHGEVARRREALDLGVLGLLWLQFEHLKQSILAATGDPASARVPAQRCQLDLVWNGDLMCSRVVDMNAYSNCDSYMLTFLLK